MVAMPSCWASSGRRISTGLPFHSMVPVSGGKTPQIALTRVDLPAPLLPTRPTASPTPISRSTSQSACTAPNRLETPRTVSRGLPLTGTTSKTGPVLCTPA